MLERFQSSLAQTQAVIHSSAPAASAEPLSHSGLPSRCAQDTLDLSQWLG